MRRTPYYLWQTSDTAPEEYLKEKPKCTDAGFRAVTFHTDESGICAEDLLKKVIQNHVCDPLPDRQAPTGEEE